MFHSGFKKHRNMELLTNTDKDNEELYSLAIQSYKKNGGKLRLYVDRDAYDYQGRKLDDLIAIKTYDTLRDHSEFWRFLEKFEEENYPERFI